MKIAVKNMKIGLWLLAIGCSVAPAAAWAVDDGMPPAMPLPSTMASAAPAVSSSLPMPVAPAPAMAAPTAAPAMAAPPAASSDAPDPEMKMAEIPGAISSIGKKDDPLQNAKVPDSVKNVVKKLTVTTKDMTLDDLNAAREAVAKLDALLDIEKRLVDLDKLHKEHEGKSNFAEAVPASALMPPMNQNFGIQPESPPMPMGGLTPDIVRIEGSNGHYVALVKSGTSAKIVHVGEHLSDGSTVLAITADGVELERGATRHLARVQDVQNVFGDSP